MEITPPISLMDSIINAVVDKMKRPSPHLNFEMTLWREGLHYLAGLDEAGRGALAGPVAAGAVILPVDDNLLQQLSGVRDSKLMTHHQREIWAEEIKRTSLTWGVGFAANEEIDAMGIVPATRLAMKRALEQLTLQPQHLLIDALNLPENVLPQTKIIKGDQQCLSIASASVLAKTARDELMQVLSNNYPDYGFEKHKGYGTRFHLEALLKLKPSLIHRRSFAPIKTMTIDNNSE